MDEKHLPMAAEYIEMNPVAAKLVTRPEDSRWSSARAHLTGEDDELVKAAPFMKLVDDGESLLT